MTGAVELAAFRARFEWHQDLGLVSSAIVYGAFVVFVALLPRESAALALGAEPLTVPEAR